MEMGERNGHSQYNNVLVETYLHKAIGAMVPLIASL